MCIRDSLSAAANVTVTVTDANGNVVATLPKGDLAAGDNTLTWNGKDASGNTLPDGDYKVSIKALSASGAAVPYTSSLNMKVDSVVFNTDGSISLVSNGHTFDLSNVLQVLA
jgi:flagellar basal-body rod modification protein FlgD